MELREYILFYLVLMAIMKDVLGALKCSQCLSDVLVDCANNPPPAEPCYSYEERQEGPVNCMIAKKTNTSGHLVQFIRGCTGVWTGSGCMDQSDNTILCYEICSTDYCNTASNCQPSIIRSILFIIYVITGVINI